MLNEWLTVRAEMLGHTQADVHRLLAESGHAVHITAVNKWFLGHRVPSRRHLNALLDLLAVNDTSERNRIHGLAAKAAAA